MGTETLYHPHPHDNDDNDDAAGKEVALLSMERWWAQAEGRRTQDCSAGRRHFHQKSSIIVLKYGGIGTDWSLCRSASWSEGDLAGGLSHELDTV